MQGSPHNASKSCSEHGNHEPSQNPKSQTCRFKTPPSRRWLRHEMITGHIGNWGNAVFGLMGQWRWHCRLTGHSGHILSNLHACLFCHIGHFERHPTIGAKTQSRSRQTLATTVAKLGGSSGSRFSHRQHPRHINIVGDKIAQTARTHHMLATQGNFLKRHFKFLVAMGAFEFHNKRGYKHGLLPVAKVTQRLHNSKSTPQVDSSPKINDKGKEKPKIFSYCDLMTDWG